MTASGVTPEREEWHKHPSNLSDLRWDTVDTLPGTLEQIYLTPYPETESCTNMFLKLLVWTTTQEELIIILLLKFKEYARSGNLEYSLGWEENVTDTPTIYMT